MIGTAIPSKISGNDGEALQKQKTPLDVLTDSPTSENIKQVLVFLASEYGINQDAMTATIKCESGFSANPAGSNDHGLAFGVAQFHKPTFQRYCSGKYYSATDQLVCFAEMLKKGLGDQWTCWRKYFQS